MSTGSQVVPAAFDKDAVLARLAQMRPRAQVQEFKAPEELNMNRPLLCVRVMRTMQPADKSWKKVEGIVTGFPYEKPEMITNHKGTKVAEYVPGTAGSGATLTIYPPKLEDYETNRMACIKEFGGLVDRANGQEELKFTVGQSVSFTSDVSIDSVQKYSLVVVGLSASRYCRSAEDQRKEVLEERAKGNVDAMPFEGVTQKIKQIEVKENANPAQVMEMVATGAMYDLPVPTPADLIAANNYTHQRQIERKDRSKACSLETLYIPMNMSDERALTLFGSGPGLLGCEFQWDEGSFWYQRRKDKLVLGRVKGSIIIKQYHDYAQLRRFMESDGDIFQLELYTCPFIMWDPLPATKITGVDTWAKFAPMIFAQPDLVAVANVELYDTADNAMNSPEWPNKNEHYMALRVRDVLFDFGRLVKSVGIPASAAAVRSWFAQDDVRCRSTTTPRDDKGTKLAPVRIERNQLDSRDTSVLLLNEWTRAELAKFLSGSAIADYDYYVLLPKKLSAPVQKRIRLVSEWAKARATPDSPYTGPLCDPFLWPEWDNEPDAYQAAMGGHAEFAMDDGHPLLTNPINNVVRADEQMLVYAVDRMQRKRIEEDARNKKLHIEPPSTRLAIEAAGVKRKVGDSAANEAQPEKKAAGEPFQIKLDPVTPATVRNDDYEASTDNEGAAALTETAATNSAAELDMSE